MFDNVLVKLTSAGIGLACLAAIALQVPPPANQMPIQYAPNGHAQLVLLGVGVVTIVVTQLIKWFHSGGEASDADRAQFTTPLWMPATLIGLAVLLVILEHVGLL